MDTPLTPDLTRFIRGALDEVSRTFALGIGLLRDPLRDEVGIAYLICRVLDTVEDSTALPAAQRAGLLRRCAADLLHPERSSAIVRDLMKRFHSLPGDDPDARLCRAAARVMEAYARLPDDYHCAVRPSIEAMAQGMASALEGEAEDERTTLASLADLDRYCYYVAGTVGELLTNLFCLRRSIVGPEERVLRDHAVAFGLGLQITNVLKGVRDDLTRGVVYLPQALLDEAGLRIDDLAGRPDAPGARRLTAALVGHTLRHLDSALVYTLALPRNERDLRLFCALPVLFALRTLSLGLERPELSGSEGKLKITREEVGALHAEAEMIVGDDARLAAVFARERARVHEALGSVAATGTPGARPA